MEDKPKTIAEYKNWLRERHARINFRRLENHFGIVVDRVAKLFQNCQFWLELGNQNLLRDFDQRYRIGHDNYPLLAKHQLPELNTKSFDSFLLKTFRRNVLENENWPHPPNCEGTVPTWLSPENWLTKINDVVRTCFVVKYIDGVAFLIDQLTARCALHSVECRSHYVSNEDGYYAAHLYIRQDFEVPRITLDTEFLRIEVELQVTTELQHVIKQMLHKHYETRRTRNEKPTEQWQWNYKSTEFRANYLGHVLHYAEGMILDVRDRQGRRDP